MSIPRVKNEMMRNMRMYMMIKPLFKGISSVLLLLRSIFFLSSSVIWCFLSFLILLSSISMKRREMALAAIPAYRKAVMMPKRRTAPARRISNTTSSDPKTGSASQGA